MKTEVDYTGLLEEDKRAKAVQDIKDYLRTTDLFEKISTECYKASQDFYDFSFYCAFVGIEGYPVRALWETLQEQGESGATD